MANPLLTKAEFEQKRGPRPDRVAVSAEMDGLCDYEGCEGWHWTRKEWWEDDVKYGIRPAADLKVFESA